MVCIYFSHFKYSNFLQPCYITKLAFPLSKEVSADLWGLLCLNNWKVKKIKVTVTGSWSQLAENCLCPEVEVVILLFVVKNLLFNSRCTAVNYVPLQISLFKLLNFNCQTMGMQWQSHLSYNPLHLQLQPDQEHCKWQCSTKPFSFLTTMYGITLQYCCTGIRLGAALQGYCKIQVINSSV